MRAQNQELIAVSIICYTVTRRWDRDFDSRIVVHTSGAGACERFWCSDGKRIFFNLAPPCRRPLSSHRLRRVITLRILFQDYRDEKIIKQEIYSDEVNEKIFLQISRTTVIYL